MESKINYTMVGLTVVILTAGLIIAGLWLSIGFDRKEYNMYTVYMNESVTGLSEESLVKYNGVKVGQVSKIELSKFDPRRVKILLKIEEGTPITTSTYATLITQGITGTTYLGLSPSSSTFVPLQKTPGEPYPVIPAKPSFFNRLEKNINDISHGFKRILTQENSENLKESLSNLQKISYSIAKNDENINKSLQELPKVIHELKAGIHKFGKMTEDMSKAGNQFSMTMKAGKDGIDKISQQTIPPAIILLRRLDLIAANLEIVSAQMRQNPAVIIRGSTPPKSGPGE
ncbi:MlaD family protein [Legionella oakridgensis]|uniref:ABC-type transport system involved in resistance to organic solvents, periplasmic component n=2 Tax=Legionella oakridgensis TaxID=29423 RepID=W0BHR6_9GAMM|nr:MlaD family protein [Legionella oakridgensis]AHE68172.1 ABC-type transport system involved in resistance to organic solvents, periplasmic component [Legionella oakridgensis ATCC 33761 = DSM 21215]ETO92261.1 ABC-type transport system involved in resistance to organic solvents, periplasmic component [Legionella oakridgensis RV-2-2007]KTD39627.1 ABC transport system periplasmic substrate binding protein [Legionella oakridgensis]STY21137.1 ABC transport system periplasmic substrate binding prote